MNDRHDEAIKQLNYVAEYNDVDYKFDGARFDIIGQAIQENKNINKRKDGRLIADETTQLYGLMD